MKRLIGIGAILLTLCAGIVYAGVSKIEKTGNTGPMGQPYYKITCTNGSTHRYYWHDGEWYGPYGAAGHSSKSISQLADYKCN